MKQLTFLDHQILAGMAAGKCALVVANTSSNPVINHEGEVYPDALGLGHCEVRPDGVDHWAKIKDLPGRPHEPLSRDLIAKLRGYVGRHSRNMAGSPRWKEIHCTSAATNNYK